MWSMAVVMTDEDTKDVLEKLAVEDQEPIQTLRANVRTNRSATPLA